MRSAAVRGLHWESWLIRLGVAGVLVYQLASHNRPGATVAAEGLVVTLLPLLIQKLSQTHVPRPLELAFVFGMALQFVSESLKLFEVYYYWDKVVHPTLVALTAMIAGWLLLGYRHVRHSRLPTHLAAAFGLLLGMCVGAMWEFIEFGSDWFGNADLQKSNADTMTDIFANNIGALVATLIGVWIFTHHFSPNQRQELGRIAAWLGHGPRRQLARHGHVAGALVAAAVVSVLGLSQWVDRSPPALASGLAAGQAQTVDFRTDPTADTQPVVGDWLPDPQAGICRVNLEHPNPGSEKMGLLQLAPATSFGPSFSIQAQYFEARPPKAEGTQMDAGIAFGMRDANDFYLLEESALHDILRLDRYIHGKRREVREAVLRTHGDEWHTLQLQVQGDQVTAGLDGRTEYSVAGLSDTDGGIGVWGRTSDATCFSNVSVQVP